MPKIFRRRNLLLEKNGQSNPKTTCISAAFDIKMSQSEDWDMEGAPQDRLVFIRGGGPAPAAAAPF